MLSHMRSREAKIDFARLSRRIYSYTDYLEKREKDFQDLLKKSLKGELSPEDEKKLEDIETSRVSSILAEELPNISELGKFLTNIINYSKKLMKRRL